MRNAETKFRQSGLTCNYYAGSFIFTFLFRKLFNAIPCTGKAIIIYLDLNASKTSHMRKGYCFKHYSS